MTHSTSTVQGSDSLDVADDLRPYLWLAKGSVDPRSGVSYVGDDVFPGPDVFPGRWVEAADIGVSRLHVVRWPGLPYELGAELWRVQVDEVQGIDPFPEQTISTVGKPVAEEQQLIVKRLRLASRVDTWTYEAAEEFSLACAQRTRSRVQQAVGDTLRLLEADDHGIAGAFASGEDGAEIQTLIHTAQLITIWAEALGEAESSRPVEAASATARAAALSRKAATLTYASGLTVAWPEARSRAAESYLESRRWQARWLADRLGLLGTLDRIGDGAVTGVSRSLRSKVG